jgi:hypothetical protein
VFDNKKRDFADSFATCPNEQYRHQRKIVQDLAAGVYQSL